MTVLLIAKKDLDTWDRSK